MKDIVSSAQRIALSGDQDSPTMLKVFWVWLAVGISQMSPLQLVQFIAAIFAIVYSGLQSYKLVKELWLSKKEKPDA